MYSTLPHRHLPVSTRVVLVSGKVLMRSAFLGRRSGLPAGDGGSLLDPARHLLRVELVRLAHIQGTRFLGSPDGRSRLERGSLEEGELHMMLERCEGEE